MIPELPQVRAALVGFVILASGLVALPFGPRVTKEQLARHEAQVEIDAWMRVAGPLGFTREGFEDFVVTWSDRLVTADGWITAPFKGFMSTTKTGQAWGLFAVPDADPLRFTVVGYDEAGAERVLFRRLDPDHDFLAAPLAFRRVRGVYDLGSSKKSLPPRYKNLARWVADRAFAAHPELQRVVIYQVETHTTLPGEPLDPTVNERFRMSFEREGAP